MQSGLYINVAGLTAIEKRMNTIATNVANMNTAGYRAEEVSFQALVTRKDDTRMSYVSTGTDYVSRQTGPMTRTGNPLDVAVTGNAWIAVQGPNGTIYTRDGRMQITSTGALQTLNGYPVLDAGNTAILLDPDGGPPNIAKDGMVTQGRRQIGAIGLFTIDDSAKLQRTDNSGVIPNKAPTPVLDFGSNGIEQGFVEGSNINPVMEMAKMMSIQRAFESMSTGTTDSETSLKDAIKTLGGS
jgi:flagellar basal-body rod protein FlgF